MLFITDSHFHSANQHYCNILVKVVKTAETQMLDNKYLYHLFLSAASITAYMAQNRDCC